MMVRRPRTPRGDDPRGRVSACSRPESAFPRRRCGFTDRKDLLEHPFSTHDAGPSGDARPAARRRLPEPRASPPYCRLTGVHMAIRRTRLSWIQRRVHEETIARAPDSPTRSRPESLIDRLFGAHRREVSAPGNSNPRRGSGEERAFDSRPARAVVARERVCGATALRDDDEEGRPGIPDPPLLPGTLGGSAAAP